MGRESGVAIIDIFRESLCPYCATWSPMMATFSTGVSFFRAFRMRDTPAEFYEQLGRGISPFSG